MQSTKLNPCTGSHEAVRDRKSTRLNSSHANISYAVFCLKKKTTTEGAMAAILALDADPVAALRSEPAQAYVLVPTKLNSGSHIDVAAHARQVARLLPLAA